MIPSRTVILFLLVLVQGLLFAAGEGYSEKTDIHDRPFTDFMNPVKEMPLGEGFTASLGGSLQERFQDIDNRHDFESHTFDEDFSLLTRERLNLDVHYGHLFKAFVEAQDARELKIYGKALPYTNSNDDFLDLYQGYLEVGLMDDVLDEPSLVFRVGRQELVLGKRHLFSENDWLNTGQSFDMARTTWLPDGFQIDAFAGEPVVPNPHHFDTDSSHENIAGINLKALGIPLGHTVEGFTIYKWNDVNLTSDSPGVRGNEKVFTLGGRADGHFFKNWDYDLEDAFQTGNRGGDGVTAWSTTTELGYTMPFNWRSLRLGGVYTRSSGDKSPTDRTSQTFDPLYGDQFLFHSKFLLAAPKNLEDVHFTSQARVWRGGLIEFDYHVLRTIEAKDAFYQGNGAPLRQDPTGRSGHNAGQEFDTQISHTFHENLSVTGGAFLFMPGGLFRRTGNRGDDTARNIFFMVRTSF